MKRARRIILWAYLVGVVICELTLLWSAYDNGGFQRHHTLGELAILGGVYLAAALLWPVLIVVGLLQYLRFLPYPITF